MMLKLAWEGMGAPLGGERLGSDIRRFSQGTSELFVEQNWASSQQSALQASVMRAQWRVQRWPTSSQL